MFLINGMLRFLFTKNSCEVKKSASFASGELSCSCAWLINQLPTQNLHVFKAA